MLKCHLGKVRGASPAMRNSSTPYNMAFHQVDHRQVLVLGVQVGEEEDGKAIPDCLKFSDLLVHVDTSLNLACLSREDDNVSIADGLSIEHRHLSDE